MTIQEYEIGTHWILWGKLGLGQETIRDPGVQPVIKVITVELTKDVERD